MGVAAWLPPGSPLGLPDTSVVLLYLGLLPSPHLLPMEPSPPNAEVKQLRTSTEGTLLQHLRATRLGAFPRQTPLFSFGLNTLGCHCYPCANLLALLNITDLLHPHHHLVCTLSTFGHEDDWHFILLCSGYSRRLIY